MATKYAIQQQGVADGASIPADKADGRQVNANRTVILASKEAGVAWDSGDVVYLGKKKPGEKITDIKVTTGTSFGTSTVSIGVGGDPRAGGTVTDATKYTAAKTLTTTDTPTSFGPKASTLDDDPDAEEHLWATIGVANIAAATVATIAIELCGID